jgi:hypothetical protein
MQLAGPKTCEGRTFGSEPHRATSALPYNDPSATADEGVNERKRARYLVYLLNGIRRNETYELPFTMEAETATRGCMQHFPGLLVSIFFLILAIAVIPSFVALSPFVRLLGW